MNRRAIRRWARAVVAGTLFLAFVVAVVMVAGCKRQSEPPPPEQATSELMGADLYEADCAAQASWTDCAPQYQQQHEEDALAGYMLRLGYDHWAAACGYELGKRGWSRRKLRQKCTIDFHFTGPISGRP